MPPSQSLLALIIGLSVFTLLVAVWLARWVLARQRGKPEMQRISDAIQQGAEAFLARQYRTIAGLAIVVAVLIYVSTRSCGAGNAADPVSDPKTLAIYFAVSFLLGALSSGIAGFMGMWTSIRANIRVAAAAMTSLNGALQTALRGGAVAGLFVVAHVAAGRRRPVRDSVTLAPAGVSSMTGSSGFHS